MTSTRPRVAHTTALLTALGLVLAATVSSMDGAVANARVPAAPGAAGGSVTGTVTPATVHRNTTTPGLTPAESDWRELLTTHPELEEVWTYSPSMNRNVPLLLLPAGRPGAPTLYMLNGVDGGPGTSNWFGVGEAVDFYRDKGVNVVVPVDGRSSYYSDWLAPSPLDRADRGGLTQRWDTYLTGELPGPLEESLEADGRRAILGLSMSATSSLLLTEHHPGLYHATAAVSGCYDTTSMSGRAMVDQVVANDDTGATADQLWGPADGDYARANNPVLHLDRLDAAVQGHELPLYVSAATGLLSATESTEYGVGAAIGSATGQYGPADAVESAVMLGVGSLLEAGSLDCTRQLDSELARAGVPADIDYRPAGLHSWTSFAEAPAASWPTLSRGLFA
jgi:diacylglycerol O-acyltransferase/trehalose O-mycolyltransferase